ncbi:MAG: hypothetical protein EOP36_20530 [Rubrivivax sp.]|nr:MAG: hypothetical protein EOP36_20530 [Rubrivivax sp.]
MAGGAGFAQRLSAYLLAHFKADLPRVIVFVPTSRVAARVRAALATEIVGVLPAVLPLKGNGELADLLGFERAGCVSASAARIEIFQVLKRLGSSDGEDGAAPLEMPTGERLWRRVDGIYRMLDRLALYGLGVADLRRSVPPNMVGLWDQQADLLVQVAAHMERWLARRSEVLPGGAERRVLVQAGEILAQPDCGWIPVVAGIVGAGSKDVKAELGVLRAAAARGVVLVPELGPVTAGLVEELEAALEVPAVRLRMEPAQTLRGVAAATEWDEAWMVALAVRRYVSTERPAGRKGTVGVVSPSAEMLRRVASILATWGIVAPVRGDMCLDKTPEGRLLLAQDWGLKGGRAADWLVLLDEFAGEEFAAVKQALAVLADQSAWLEQDDWRALMALVLGETMAPVAPVSTGVILLGPLDARLMDFDHVIAAGCVEGVWPALTQDAWLSEPHLRALGLADSARSALLAGTEFESLVHGGSADVLLTRSTTQGGRDMVASRFMDGLSLTDDRELTDALDALRGVDDNNGEPLGMFVPLGDLWPKRWSASFVEAMLACPFKALGERILKLEPLDPLVPDVDARMAGLLAHRWLEKLGARQQTHGLKEADAWVADLLEVGEMELRKEPPVIRAVWRSKMKKLAPALVARWLADGRAVAAVEKRLSKPVGRAAITATADRVEQEADGGQVIIDFKTSTPPSWSSVMSGERPQLAIEAWLADGAVAGLEYWHLRGYGTSPLSISRAGDKKSPPVDALVAPVGDGVARLVETFDEGQPFPAVPDMAGGGLLATGHCERCALAGVCRRKVASHV